MREYRVQLYFRSIVVRALNAREAAMAVSRANYDSGVSKVEVVATGEVVDVALWNWR